MLSHSTLCFGATEVMNFRGRKLVGNFRGELVSDLSSFVCRRVGGSRMKHRVQQNWLKMYDKAGLVLRVETVINNPEEFRARKQILRDGKQRAEWVALRKGVAPLFRCREVSLQANARYLDALAAVDDPKKASARVRRCFWRLPAHGLTAKIPRTRRWRVTAYRHQAMGTSLFLREHPFPNVYATAAAA